jgi:small subunit ribosomal protein S18
MKHSNSSKVSNQNNDDNIVNAMVGDITYEELSKIPDISSIALAIKKISTTSGSGSNTIFKKQSNLCAFHSVDDKYVSYKNVKFIKRYISSRGKINPARSIGIRDKKKQRMLRVAILRARFLGLLPYVKY